MVFGVMEGGREQELRYHIGVVKREMESGGNDMLWCHFSTVLAIVLSQQGRLIDACVVDEGVLKHLRLKAAGSGGGGSITQEMMRVSMQNLAGSYGKMGRLADALKLQDEIVLLLCT